MKTGSVVRTFTVASMTAIAVAGWAGQDAEQSVVQLPDGYRQVEYVQGDGVAYARLGIYLGSSDTVDVVAMVDKSVEVPDAGIFGGRDSGNSRIAYFWTFKSDENAVNASYGSDGTIGRVFFQSKEKCACFIGKKVLCHIGSDRRGFYAEDGAPLFDGAVKTQAYTPTSFTCADECRLFICSGGIAGWATHAFVGRIYSFTVSTNGVARMNLVPCVHQDEVGFYDTVGGGFYGNAAGSGSFSCTGGIEVGDIPDQPLTGAPVEPDPAVTFGGIRLVRNKDYSLNYENNVGIGLATMNILGLGDYEGQTAVLRFAIVRPSGGPIRLTGDFTRQAVNEGGSAVVRGLQVYNARGEKLDAATYDVGYVNNTRSGTATVWVKVTSGEFLGAVDGAAFEVSIVPRSYRVIEYVQGDGVAYVDTGVLPGNLCQFEVVAKADKAAGCIFGGRKEGFVEGCYWTFNETNHCEVVSCFGNMSGVNNVLSFTGKADQFVGRKVLCHLGSDRRGFYAEDGSVLINGAENSVALQDSWPASQSRVEPICLFKATGKIVDWAPRGFTGRIYSFTCLKGGVPQMNLVPCVYRNEVGFYDTVGGGFYGNAAEGGKFIPGRSRGDGFMILVRGTY